MGGRGGWYAVMTNSRIAAGDPASQMKEIRKLAALLGVVSRVLIPDVAAIVFLARKTEKNKQDGD